MFRIDLIRGPCIQEFIPQLAQPNGNILVTPLIAREVLHQLTIFDCWSWRSFPA
jgi:hypothetical protein